MTIALTFSKELSSLGYKPFLAKTDILIGEDWLKKLYQELQSCRYFLLLLSKNSLESEMVLEEVKFIKELQDGSPFPAILPVRINLPFDYNINYDLLRQINSIQHLSWESMEDTTRVIDKISTVISNDEVLQESTESLPLIDIGIPVFNAPLEQPTGTVPFDSHYYIEREDDKRCYMNLSQRYTLIRIKAPRQYGKTSLLARLILRAKEKNYNIVSFNFQLFDRQVLNNLDELLEYICEMIAYRLDIEVNINKRLLKRLLPKEKATEYLHKILISLDKPLVLAIDEADKLFEYSKVSDDFFGLIRAWHEQSKVDPIWENLKILLSHSTEPLLGITSIHQSPFHNVGLGVELNSFTKDELIELAKRHGVHLDSTEIDRFIRFVGGHPYLSRKILYTMIEKRYSLSQVIENRTLFDDHMRRYLWILENNSKLMGILKSIIEGDTCKDDSSCYILEATGLIKNTIHQPKFSCELYQEFFTKKLLG